MSEKTSHFAIRFNGDDPFHEDDPDYDFNPPCAKSALGGGFRAADLDASEDDASEEAAQETRLSLHLVTDGVRRGSSVATGAGVTGQLRHELAIDFGPTANELDRISTCCAEYVKHLCWTPQPWRYPDFDPPGLETEFNPPSPDSVNEAEAMKLDLDNNRYPIVHYRENESSIEFAYIPDGMRVSVPTGPANSWLASKIGTLRQSVSSFSYKLTWEPPMPSECKPDDLFVAGPIPSGEVRKNGRLQQHATTLPISFYLNVGGEEHLLQRLLLEPKHSDASGYLYFHDPLPGTMIANIEYVMQMQQFSMELVEYREARLRGENPKPPSMPDQPAWRDSRFNDALDLSPDMKVDDDSLYDLLDRLRGDDGFLPDAQIIARVERTYGRWNFTLNGTCPNCSQEDGANCRKTSKATADQGAYFNRDPPGAFTPSFIGDTATFPVARLVNLTKGYHNAVAPSIEARLIDRGWQEYYPDSTLYSGEIRNVTDMSVEFSSSGGPGFRVSKPWVAPATGVVSATSDVSLYTEPVNSRGSNVECVIWSPSISESRPYDPIAPFFPRIHNKIYEKEQVMSRVDDTPYIEWEKTDSEESSEFNVEAGVVYVFEVAADGTTKGSATFVFEEIDQEQD